ncbi:head-tail connector protein [Candidimonas humi]|uniref:Head-tail connector protein n=1 Tax=Candidimonas humi TaxID=683355 RepID=A0ABV8NYS9_9BURK|nr:head-tail connector protein [Candidimonas humi]MBV6304932.1 head-tail connector protein [Candidimonas humi]
MNLVTLDQAKLRLRMDTDDLDDDIELMISAASTIILRYLDSAADEFLDSNGDVPTDSNGDAEVPADVQTAALYLVGTMLRDPDGSDTQKWESGYLPPMVVSLLASRRIPPLA